MKGIVFTTFNDMVEKEAGIDVWESVLAAVDPESGGIYTAVEDFPDSELMSMVAELSRQIDTPQTELIEAFGEYLFHALTTKHPAFADEEPDFLNFLKSIDDVIHKEVKKLYQNPNLPSLKWEQPDPQTLIIFYRSPRKLCALAVGLIRGAAEHYDVNFELNHNLCMHSGEDYCRLLIKVSE